MSPVFGPCRSTASCVTNFDCKLICQGRRNATTPVVGEIKAETRSAPPLPTCRADVLDEDRSDENLSKAGSPGILITATVVIINSRLLRLRSKSRLNRLGAPLHGANGRSSHVSQTPAPQCEGFRRIRAQEVLPSKQEDAVFLLTADNGYRSFRGSASVITPKRRHHQRTHPLSRCISAAVSRIPRLCHRELSGPQLSAV
jgi:hypothetical protein